MDKLKSQTFDIYNGKRQPDLILAVVGSRSLVYYKNRVYYEINELRKIHNIIEIVSGDCPKGIDLFAKQYAEEHKIHYRGIPALWDDIKTTEPCIVKYNQHGAYNVLAGINRNSLIAHYCTGGIVLWDGKSTGTKDIGNKLFLRNKLIKKIVIPV